MLHYSAFGLRLAANLPVPGLQPEPIADRVDAHIGFGAAPTIVDAERERVWYVGSEEINGIPALVASRVDGTYFRLRYADGTEFVIDDAARHIAATWQSPCTLEDAATYLLGPVMGFVLRRRGRTCLHGSAVAIADRAVAFIGAPYSGKSTLAAAFSQCGHFVLTDDVLPLDERADTIYATPAYPQLRLWPDSVALLFGNSDALPPMTPTWDKRGLDLTETNAFQARPLPLAAVYVLDPQDGSAPPRIEPLQGRETVVSLLANTYVS
jgi:hypothetical protein